MEARALDDHPDRVPLDLHVRGEGADRSGGRVREGVLGLAETDILLREADRNVFIAECKFWKGPKAFKEAIDQLLRYTTWRDGKTAILIFNRGIDTTTVMNGIDAQVKEHPNFKRAVSWSHESGFRYVLRANDDAGRELFLTVLVFHVPA